VLSFIHSLTCHLHFGCRYTNGYPLTTPPAQWRGNAYRWKARLIEFTVNRSPDNRGSTVFVSIFFFIVRLPLVDQGLLVIEGLRPHSRKLHRTSNQSYAETSTWQHTKDTEIHAPGGIRPPIPAGERSQTHALDQRPVGSVMISADKWFTTEIFVDKLKVSHLNVPAWNGRFITLCITAQCVISSYPKPNKSSPCFKSSYTVIHRAGGIPICLLTSPYITIFCNYNALRVLHDLSISVAFDLIALIILLIFQNVNLIIQCSQRSHASIFLRPKQ
jgi:hypothetical protein